MTAFTIASFYIKNLIGADQEAPYDELASDHGQIMAHIRLGNAG